MRPAQFALAAFGLLLLRRSAHVDGGRQLKERVMARATQASKQPEPMKDDLEAYYVATKATTGHLRRISAIEQMYGYYTAG